MVPHGVSLFTIVGVATSPTGFTRRIPDHGRAGIPEARVLPCR